MAETVDEDSGVGRSVEASTNGQYSLSGEALSQWRCSTQVENGTPSTSPSYWDTDDDDDYGTCFPLCKTWLWTILQNEFPHTLHKVIIGWGDVTQWYAVHAVVSEV